jgi:SepF-like predicted cell division protein (DUF552 family)
LLSLKPDAVWPPARSSDDDSVVLTCEDGSAREVAAALEEASPEEELLLTETTVRLPTRFDGRTELEEALARVAPHVHGTHAKICDVSMSERYGVILTSAGARVQRLHFVVDGDDEWTLRFRALVAASESEPGAED